MEEKGDDIGTEPACKGDPGQERDVDSHKGPTWGRPHSKREGLSGLNRVKHHFSLTYTFARFLALHAQAELYDVCRGK